MTLNRTRTLSENAPEEERVVREEGVARASSPLTQGRISVSDESEGEVNDEPADWHSSPWHPKPLAVPNLTYFYTQTQTGLIRSLSFDFQFLSLN